MQSHTKKEFRTSFNDFDTITLKLASPERIVDWSFGEVTKAETMNYRTQRSEKHGLFDEKIFGPEKDYECYCGKYKGIRYKGIVCDKCGVEITRSIVRRERMGHITLSSPVAHIWFLRSIPSRIALVLGMTAGDVEKVVYFAGYLITEVDDAERSKFLRDLDAEYKSKTKSLQDDKSREALTLLMSDTKAEIESIVEGRVLDEIEYHNFSMKYGSMFEAKIGAEAIYNLCKRVELEKLAESLANDVENGKGVEREKAAKRLSLVRSMIRSGIRPEWMFLVHIPVIPPALRPMVALEGGRHATSDVNDLYRRVINRNNRLKKLMEINAPDVILRNEKRILQEAVDALIDNSIRHGQQAYSANAAQKRPLKSLSDNLKGKRGLFRQNLLGKRVDYSGRSVIVVGPSLKLNQCGLPKHMALELFRPFIIAKLLERELAFNIRGANRLIDDGVPEVWEILEEVIFGKYVLLNRAPTLHRLSIQAFQPVLIEGNAIQVHPLVCTAFNADFDGDQMAVHIPLSEEAQYEAREIMAADRNVLKPGSGEPTVAAKLLDIVLGVYWMTKVIPGAKGEGRYFEDANAAMTAAEQGIVDLRAKIRVLGDENVAKFDLFEGKHFETTVGRLRFNQTLPADYPYLNEVIEKKRISKLFDELIEKYGSENIQPILDSIKTFGFEHTTKSGITWGLEDIREPEGKDKLIEAAQLKVNQIYEQYNEGFLSDDEKTRKIVEIWHAVKSDVEKIIPATLEEHGPVYDMVYSGARGSFSQITIMAGLKGLIQSTTGEPIEFPVLSSSKKGLSPIEYFITTHGSRKGLTDTALNTARAGYLTRKLFDVAQDVVVSEIDCGTKNFIEITKDDSGSIVPLSRKIRGRILAEDVKDAEGKTMFKKGHLLSKKEAQSIEESTVPSVSVRSPLACGSARGVCATCYGLDLGRNKMIDIGEAVGTVAAQAIGEPGTQLTMRTFHAGGAASVGGDITQGLPRVEEVFEKRGPKHPAVVTKVGGVVADIVEAGKERLIKILADATEKKKGGSEVEYSCHYLRVPLVKVGDRVEKGDILTDGSADIDDLFDYAGKEKTQNYIIAEINRLYELQGEPVSRKHIEVIVRQMFSRRKVKKHGDTNFSDGDVVALDQLEIENNRVKALGGMEATSEDVVMGITEASLSRHSFLSAASFQNTVRILIRDAIRGKEERMVGLKENVIIGRLIPAGSGFSGSAKHKEIAKLVDAREAEWRAKQDAEEAAMAELLARTVDQAS
jgi:DNA-directed RNA polymerase subunit beta'